MKHLIFLLFVGTLLCSCRPSKPLSVNESVRDSRVVTEVVRDTVVTVEPDSSMLRALMECDSLGQVRLSRLLDYESGKRTRPPMVSINDNVLIAKSVVDSMSIYLEFKDRYKEHYKTSYKVSVVETNRLTGWQKLRLRLGELFIIATVCGLVLFVIRKYR